MFFDPTMKPEVKADPFSLESVIAWLEKQPARKPYPYSDARGCLACQYLQAHGYVRPWESPFSGMYLYAEAMAGHYSIALEQPWTFGAALKRARALVK